MEELRQPIILTSVALYMVVCIAVGLWAMRRTHSARDFFMAGRHLGFLVTGVAIFSSTMSGFGFVGGPGLVYALGWSSVWILITIGFSPAISDFLLGKRLRLFAGYCDSVSLPDVVAARYGDERVRLMTALAILLGVLGYLATQILAMATVLQSILQQTQTFSEISLAACMVVSVSVLVFYCVTGGIIAGVYTDMVQGAVMVTAGLLVFLTAISVFDGGPAEAVTVLMQDDPEAVGPWGALGMIGCLSWYFIFAAGGAGQPHLLTKVMMIKDIRSYRWVPLVNICGYCMNALLWISIGLVMRALVVAEKHPELAFPDAAAPEFLQNYAHPILAGVVFAGLFAAIMSTADAFLNIGAAALVHDVPKALRGLRTGNAQAMPPERELLWARIATVGLALAAALFALYSHTYNDRLIALLGAFGWGTFAAALVPAVAIGLNWKRATPLAASVAIAASLIVNFGIEVSGVHIPGGVNGGTISLLLSLLLFFTISFASKPPKIDPEIEALMDI